MIFHATDDHRLTCLEVSSTGRSSLRVSSDILDNRSDMATSPVRVEGSEQLSPLFNQLSLHDGPVVSPAHGKASHSAPRDVEATSLDGNEALSAEIGRLLNQIYGEQRLFGRLFRQPLSGVAAEVQELRHSSELSSNPITSTHSDLPLSKIDTLLSSLDDSVASLASRTSALPSQASPNDGAGSDAAKELRRDWERVVEQHAMLKEEMKEDGWLIRYRTWVARPRTPSLSSSLGPQIKRRP